MGGERILAQQMTIEAQFAVGERRFRCQGRRQPTDGPMLLDRMAVLAFTDIAMLKGQVAGHHELRAPLAAGGEEHNADHQRDCPTHRDRPFGGDAEDRLAFLDRPPARTLGARTLAAAPAKLLRSCAMPSIATLGRQAFGGGLASPAAVRPDRAFIAVGQMAAQPALIWPIVRAIAKPEILELFEHWLDQAKA